MKAIFIFLTILLSVNACNDKSGNKGGTTTETPDDKTSLGDTIQLYYQQSAQIDASTSISFSNLKDSRCPQGLNCVQAGQAVVTIKMEQKGAEPITGELTAKGLCYGDDNACGSLKRIGDYKIRLFNVYPYPEGGVAKEAKKDYVKLMVNK